MATSDNILIYNEDCLLCAAHNTAFVKQKRNSFLETPGTKFLESGFNFTYENIEDALRQIVNNISNKCYQLF